MRRLDSTAFAVLFGALTFVAEASSLSAQTGAAGAKTGPTLQFGGLVQVQAEAGDRGDSRFSSANDRIFLRRARLNASGKFLEHFDFKLEVELAGSLAEASSLRAQATDAYITWNRSPAAAVRFGQFKSPFGHEQLFVDSKLPTIERSLVNDRLTLGRQIGAQVGGELFDKRLFYAAGVFNGNGTNTSANDNDRFATIGRVSAQVFRGKLRDQDSSLVLGGGFYSSEDAGVTIAGLGFDATPASSDRDNLFAGKREGLGFDLQLKAPGARFEVWAEWLEGHFEPLSGRPRASLDAEGFAVQGMVFLRPDRLELVLRHESFDPDALADANESTIDTLGVNYFLKGHDLKAMINLLRIDDRLQAEAATRVLVRMQILF